MAEAPKEQKQNESKDDKSKKKLIVISGVTSGIGAVVFFLLFVYQ